VTSAEIVQRFYVLQRRFYVGEDVAAQLADVLAADVAWHVPGRSAIAGVYQGIDQVLAYFARRRELADQTLRIIERGVLADEQQVVHFADGEATIDGQRRRWRTVGIFTVRSGRIAECLLLPFNQYEFDEIWSAR
jgi:ketosteroid isomerase-like protein